MKFAELLLNRLKDTHSYTHCFFVAGGNTMHLLDIARSRFECIPFIHEVSAAIAAEYFNESNQLGEKAFALVTAGPGLTNCVTAIAGAYLENRELLVIGGQVKSSDLKSREMRQNGIQEIDGVELVKSITRSSVRLDSDFPMSKIDEILWNSSRPGPVFFEIPLDQQAKVVQPVDSLTQKIEKKFVDVKAEQAFINNLISSLSVANRPVILLGGGLKVETSRMLIKELEDSGIPIMTTWNGINHYGSDNQNYWGRPNTWGQRSANMLIQQADLLIAVGARMGLQQTGFAWKEFAPLAKIFQIEIDKAELSKNHPKIENKLCSDANSFLKEFLSAFSKIEKTYSEWLEFGEQIKKDFPLSDKSNKTGSDYLNPYDFIKDLSDSISSDTNIVPCSSGGAFTVTMQALESKLGQTVTSNKGLASMGYGLAGAIGAALGNPRKTILIEGDGGFAQNIQELGTAKELNLNLGMFIFSNEGYASIRMTQRNYFNGAYVGCDRQTGLGLPDLKQISSAYGISYFIIDSTNYSKPLLMDLLKNNGPILIEVKIDPEQTYWPKIDSRVLPDGSMASNPLHLMSPMLDSQSIKKYLPYLIHQIDSDYLEDLK